MKKIISLFLLAAMLVSIINVSSISIVSADTTVSPVPVNVALNKPVYKPDDHTYYSESLNGSKMVDGSTDSFVYLNADGSTTFNYLKIDLLNYYNISSIGLYERPTNWDRSFLDGAEIAGSIENEPVEEMTLIKNLSTNRNSSAGKLITIDMPEMTKYRYIAIRAVRPINTSAVLCLAEFKVFATNVSENIGAWTVMDSTNTSVKNISNAGGAYSVSIPVTNYNTARTDYVLIAGTYDTDGMMTEIVCAKVLPGAIGTETILSTSIVVPPGTKKLSAVLIESLNNALMIADSLNLAQ